MPLKKNHKEQISLDSATTHILEECRMVLPGIQALFGFQLISVFNAGFTERLSSLDQRLHLLSICLIVVSVALVMAPAALHRQSHLTSVSERFLQITSVFLLCSMLTLAIGLCIEIYLIAEVILNEVAPSLIITGIFFFFFLFLWVILPRMEHNNG
jgi:hypothetical protein